jgi:hypothetical protein
MRRVIATIAFTIMGLYLLLTYKSSPVGPIVALSTPAPTDTTSSRSETRAGSEGAGASPTAPPPRTIPGSVVMMRWGPVQVAVTMQGGRITDVNALQLPVDHQRSAYISQQVAPYLRMEVLQAQGANIDSISGATYTVDAYVQSLQAALDSVGT